MPLAPVLGILESIELRLITITLSIFKVNQTKEAHHAAAHQLKVVCKWQYNDITALAQANKHPTTHNRNKCQKRKQNGIVRKTKCHAFYRASRWKGKLNVISNTSAVYLLGKCMWVACSCRVFFCDYCPHLHEAAISKTNSTTNDAE